MEILKKIIVTIILTCSLYGHGQVIDNFDDGDFTRTPIWSSIDISDFEVLNGELHLNAPTVTNKSHLATLSQSIIDASWEFNFRLNTSTSSSNQAFIYLVSDRENLENNPLGYYVLIGNNNCFVKWLELLPNSIQEIIDIGSKKNI